MIVLVHVKKVGHTTKAVVTQTAKNGAVPTTLTAKNSPVLATLTVKNGPVLTTLIAKNGPVLATLIAKNGPVPAVLIHVTTDVVDAKKAFTMKTHFIQQVKQDTGTKAICIYCIKNYRQNSQSAASKKITALRLLE